MRQIVGYESVTAAIYKCLKGTNFKTVQTRVMVLVLCTSSNGS